MLSSHVVLAYRLTHTRSCLPGTQPAYASTRLTLKLPCDPLVCVLIWGMYESHPAHVSHPTPVSFVQALCTHRIHMPCITLCNNVSMHTRPPFPCSHVLLCGPSPQGWGSMYFIIPHLKCVSHTPCARTNLRPRNPWSSGRPPVHIHAFPHAPCRLDRPSL